MVTRRSLILGGIGSALGAALLTGALYRSAGSRTVEIDFERAFEAPFARGFYPREGTEGAWFRWSGARAELSLRSLPSSGRARVEADIRVRRPAGDPLPEITFTVDGLTVHSVAARGGRSTYRFEFPLTRPSPTLGIESDTFEVDGRTLGIQPMQVRLELPEGEPRRWFPPAATMGLVGLLVWASFVVTGIAPRWAGVLTSAFTGGFWYLLAQRSLRFSSYPTDLLLLALATLAIVLLSRMALTRWGWPHPPERPMVLAILGATFLLELGALSYPLWLSSDADFQLNRFGLFLAGDWFPTSVTQHEPPFRIPYPIALYATAAPLVWAGLDRLLSLQVAIVLADVGLVLALFGLARGYRSDSAAGGIAGVVTLMVPIHVLSLSAGNFTNHFGVAMTALAMTSLLAAWSDRGKLALAATAVFSLLALISHFGLAIEGLLLWPAWLIALLRFEPSAAGRRAALGSVAVAMAIAGIYYLGYRDLVWEQLPRLAEGGGGGSSLGERLALAGAVGVEQLGVVFLVVSALGAALLLRSPAKTPLHLAGAVWLSVTFFFLLLDLVSSLQIRYALQVLPLLALVSGSYLSGAWARGRIGKAATLAVLAHLIFRGLVNLHLCLLSRYHY